MNGQPPIPGDLRLVGLLENCDKLAETPIPTLVLYGDADNVVPPFQAELLHRASAAGANKRLVCFPGRGHNDLTHHASYWPSVIDFIDRALT